MHQIKEYCERLIIQVGHIYTLSDGDYKVLTATAEMRNMSMINTLQMQELVYHMKNTETNGIRYITKEKLEKEIRQHNEVSHLFEHIEHR